MPLAPDAPGDNQFVQNIFSLVIAPGPPFLGRLTWLIAANSHLKHGMRSWLTSIPSSKHGRKIGSGREPFINLVTLVLIRGYFPHVECFSPRFLHGRVLLHVQHHLK